MMPKPNSKEEAAKEKLDAIMNKTDEDWDKIAEIKKSDGIAAERLGRCDMPQR